MKEPKRLKYFEMLNDPDVNRQLIAITELGKLRDPHIFKILARYFFDPSPEIRQALYEIFTANKEPWVADIVADTLFSPQSTVRDLTIDILKSMGREAIWPLKRLMKSPNAGVRRAAAEVLGKILTPAATDILYDHLEDPHEDVLNAVIQGLGHHREIKAVPYLVKYLEEKKAHQSVVLDSLLSILAHWQDKLIARKYFEKEGLLKESFLTAVNKYGNAFALDLVVNILFHSQDVHLQAEAIHAIHAILVAHPAIALPGNTIYILEEVWKKNPLRLDLEAFLTCVSRIPSRKSLHFLVERLQQPGTKEIARITLGGFCERFPDLVLDQYMELSPKVRIQILEALNSRGETLNYPDAAQLFSIVRSPKERRVLLQILVRSEHPDLMPFLVKEWSKPRFTNVERLQLLKHLQGARFLPIYLKGVQDRDGHIQQLARDKLIELGDEAIEFFIRTAGGRTSSSWATIVPLVSLFPPASVYKFWEGFLRNITRKKVQYIKTYIRQDGPRSILPAILLALTKEEHFLEEICQFLMEKNIKPVIQEEFNEILQKINPERRCLFEQSLLSLGMDIFFLKFEMGGLGNKPGARITRFDEQHQDAMKTPVLAKPSKVSG